MSSVRIRTRTTRGGQRRYMVAYRLGGRHGLDRSAGTFETLKLAKARRMKVMELISRGHHDQIQELANPAAVLPAPAGTWTELHQQWIDGMHNLKPATRRTYQNHCQALAQAIGDRDPLAFDWQDCRDLVDALIEQGLAPATVKAYIGTFKLVLDYAGLEPNPARDRRVKLPRQEQKQLNIPPRTHIQAIRNHLPEQLVLAFDTLEATGIRIGELTTLTRNDLDTAESRVRIANGKTHSARRWANLPPALTDQINAARPSGDDTARRLFPHLTDSTMRRAIRQACDQAGTPRYRPHDLRHRWISLALKRGMPPAEVALHAGHARQAITLNTYSHVITQPDDRWPLAWDTYGHRPDTNPTSPQPQPDSETRGPRTDTTPTP